MTVSRLRRLVALIGLIAAIVSGCGGGADAPTPAGGQPAAAAARPTAGEVCGWLTSDDAVRLVNAAPTSADPVPTALPGCQWKLPSGQPLLQVTLVPNASDSGDDYRAGLARDMGEGWSADLLASVADLGDFAFYTADARMLQVFRGRRTLQVIVSRPAGLAEARAVAEQLMDRNW